MGLTLNFIYGEVEQIKMLFAGDVYLIMVKDEYLSELEFNPCIASVVLSYIALET